MTVTASSADEARVRAWLEIREPLERQLGPLGEAVIAELAPAPGERVLDIGCGVGGTPAALAAAAGADGEIVGIDLLQPALRALADDPSLPKQVALLHGDAQSHPFEPGSFDAAFSRFGVMFFADPALAFSNIRQALRPGGRLGFVSWRRLEENELDALPLRAAAPHLPPELAAEPAAAGWFSMSSEPSIRELLTAARFTDIQISARDQLVGSGGLQAMVDVCSRVGAVGAILRRRPDLRREVVPALEAALRERDGPQGPLLLAATWVVTARAP